MRELLLEKYIKGETTLQENEAIGRWIDESPNHLKELTTKRRIYEAALWKEEAHNRPFCSKKARQTPFLQKKVIRIAAMVVVLLGVGFLFLLNKMPTKMNEEMQTLHVPAGQRAQITLSDGTKVWLNASSSLTFPGSFKNRNRQVKLDGEGFFDVTTNKAKPFIVETKNHQIRVLGTKFNVSSYAQTSSFETSLLEGAVEILDLKSNVEEKLTPGTKVTASKNGKLHKTTIKNYDYYLWRDGLICFDDISIKELLKKLEHYYDVQFAVKKNTILDQRFSGKLRVCDGVTHALEVIQLHTSFTYTKDEEKRIIIIQ